MEGLHNKEAKSYAQVENESFDFDNDVNESGESNLDQDFTKHTKDYATS